MKERDKEYYNKKIGELYSIIENQEKIIRDLQEENQELKSVNSFSKRTLYKMNKDRLYANFKLQARADRYKNKIDKAIEHIQNEIYNIEPKHYHINYDCEYDSEEDYVAGMIEQSRLNTLKENLESLDARINTIQDLKDRAVAELANAQSMITILDPDGSIQNINTTIKAELELAEKESNKIQTIIDGLISSNTIKNQNLEKEYKSLVDAKNSLIIQNQIARKEIESLMNQKENEAEELNSKIQKLSSLQSGYNYESLKSKIKEYKQELDSIASSLRSIGIDDVMKLSKDEYILALETLKDLEEYISVFKSSTDFEIIQSIVKEYLETGKVPERQDIKIYTDHIHGLEMDIASYRREKDLLTSKIGLLDKLSLRPSNCKIDTCEFIKEAMEFSKSNPKDRMDQLDAMIYEIEAEIAINNSSSLKIDEYNNAINRFAIIVREVDKNGSILSKMPNGDIFKDKINFFEKLLSGYSFDYMKSIYQYIDHANLFDMYRQTLSIYNQYLDEFKTFEGKAEIIDSLTEDIDKINKSINIILDKIEPINQEIYDRDVQISKLQELEGVYDAIFAQKEKLKPQLEIITNCRNKLLENNRKMNDINTALNKATVAKENISQHTYALEPLLKERDNLNHSIRMLDDYIKERDELQANYDFIETIKYYSSPTTGIQLVFMELYMGKIIALANELLRLLFNGQFVIQPFVINDSEFRIPCLGSGYLNDDISSMSSSQIGMISMILSFALLHHSSTKYNIIKLDEIDGPLDYNNRVYFMDVLNNIMDIMGTEQCIMISHNSELQVDNSDVILLRHDDANMDYNRGNVIWRF